MLKVIMTVGIPASGKSTWAKEEVKNNPNTVRINRDDLRIMMSNYVFSPENEKLVISTRNHILLNALRAGRDVIIDDTNINTRNFKDVCSLLNKEYIKCLVMEKSFYVDLDEAISRNSNRTGFGLVPEDVIRKMWKQSGGTQHKFYNCRVQVCGNESSESKSETNFNPKLNWSVICDLDGTISLFNPIRKDGSVEMRYPNVHVRNPYNASTSDNDSPNEAVVAVLESLYKEGYNIIFLSGREDCYKEQTERFLNKNVSFKYDLFMRKTGDSRKDSIIKEELYNSHILGKYNVLLILDDRSQVVSLWRSLGLTCWQVAPGDF